MSCMNRIRSLIEDFQQDLTKIIVYRIWLINLGLREMRDFPIYVVKTSAVRDQAVMAAFICSLYLWFCICKTTVTDFQIIHKL